MCSIDHVKTFLRNTTASMATQVVMFSVLLFGTSGVVLDFGRVYSEHTIMQSFTDQAALAAAAELNRQSDAIDRAVASVFGGVDGEGNSFGAPLSKSVGWSGGDDEEFGVSHLIFLSDMGQDSGYQSSLNGLSSEDIVYVAFQDGSSTGNAATASTQARFVVAVAEERSVRNSLMQLINSTNNNAAVGESSIVRTVSAAERKTQFCGREFSNLVMCNPFEGSEDTSFQEFMSDPTTEGIQFEHTADGTTSFRWSLMNRLDLQSIDEVVSICDDPLTMPGAAVGMSDELAQTYNTICHLAAAQPRPYCVGDEIQIVPADPEVIQTALGTAFDYWDHPISEVLDWNLDSDGNPIESVGGVGASPLRDFSPLFQPDRDIYKGRVRAAQAVIDANTAIGIPESSRLNYAANANSQFYNLILSQCLRGLNTGTCIADRIGPASDYTRIVEYYLSNFFNHFVFVAGQAPPPFSLSNFYQAYLYERDNWTHSDINAGPVASGASLAVTGEDASLASTTPLGTPQTGDFSNYTYPVDANDPLERRRMSITVVNCQAMADNGDGSFEAEVVDFIDVFLLQPPLPTCPGGGTSCTNDNATASTIYTEYIDFSEYDLTEYPVLVR